MVRQKYPWIVVILLIAFRSYASAQTATPVEPTSASALYAANLPLAPSSNTHGAYTLPDGRQQFRNYLYSTFGPPAYISTAIGAGLDQRKPAPPEWDSGAKGYAERYGWRFGMQIIGHTTEYVFAAAIHEDVAYHRCECKGFFPRSSYALMSTITAKNMSGRTVLSVPSLVGPYAGSFAAMNAWYPDRYGPKDAFRVGSSSFMFKAVGNLIGEFIAPAR